MPEDVARALTAGELPNASQTGLLVSYNFSSPAPLDDQMGFLSPLSWSLLPPSEPPQNVAIDGQSWLGSRAPVANLVEAFQKTSQFSMRVVCTPSATVSGDERIISIARPAGIVDLYFGQEDSHLIFWFRNPLSAGRAALGWTIPNTFVAGQPRDILFSYDGSNLSLYVDGRKNPQSYTLGPGTRVAESIRRIRTAELVGYNSVYDALIFFPGGRSDRTHRISEKNSEASRDISILIVGFLLPPYLYERILSHLSGRSESLESVFLCFILIVAGSLWINADRLPS